MMTRTTLLGVNATTVALALTIALAGSAIAQAPAAPPQQSPTPGKQQSAADPTNLQSLMKGLNIGPLMMSFGGAGGVMIDFTRSSERMLLQRSDVRSELFIDSKQRDELADQEQQAGQQMQKKMIETVLQNTINNPDFKALGQLSSGQKPDVSAIQDLLNSSFQGMQDGLHAFQATLDGNEEALLTAKQIKRLHELDLQWRGLLALSDKKVADEIKTTAEQKTVVDGALKTYQTVQMNLLEPLMTQAMQFGQQAASGKAAPRTLDQQEMQKTFANAMESDQIRKARAAAEAKVRASLNAGQLELWKTMTGQKFYFRQLD